MVILQWLRRAFNAALPKHAARLRVERQKFDLQNQVEVLRHYRWLMKSIPLWYPRRLEKNAAKHEIQHVFRLNNRLDNEHEISKKVGLLRQVRRKLETGYGLNINCFTDSDTMKQQWEYLV